MEYLMTYGWAILIIAVVLAALFSLNVFNAGAQLGTSCIGQPGFSCSQPIINQAGSLSFTLGQGIGYTTYNAMLSCVSSSNSLSAASLPYNGLSTTGTSVASVTAPTATTQIGNAISSGTTLSISGVICYAAASGGYSATTLSPIGQPFTGVLWMSYATTQGGTPQFVKIATVSAKSSS
jgi:hypothetical protein